MEPDRDDETRGLVDACRRGDRIAQHALYRRFVNRVHFLATRVVGRNEADDVTQNVFLQLFRCLEQYRQEARFETWLYRLTINEALQYQRDNRRWSLPTLSEERATATVDRNGRVDERELLERALTEIPMDLQVLLVLREIEGLCYRDLAEVLSIPGGTVASKLNRARHELRRKLMALGWGLK